MSFSLLYLVLSYQHFQNYPVHFQRPQKKNQNQKKIDNKNIEMVTFRKPYRCSSSTSFSSLSGLY